MIRRLIAGAAIACSLALGACASTTAGLQTPEQRLYAVKADYNALLQVALIYESKPRCQPGQGVFDACSNRGVVEDLRKADKDVFAAVEAADDAFRKPGATSSTVGVALASAEAATTALRRVLTNRGVIRQ